MRRSRNGAAGQEMRPGETDKEDTIMETSEKEGKEG
jgi:hypothetical protein